MHANELILSGAGLKGTEGAIRFSTSDTLMGPVTLANDTTIRLGDSAVVTGTITSTISGPGRLSLVASGNSRLVLTGDNSYTGGTQIDGGTLLIREGGGVAGTRTYIGFLADSDGAVTVDGDGSMLVNSAYLLVGLAGTGKLDITGSGVVENTYSHIGYYPDSQGAVTVDGAGSTWINSGNLHVGYNGTGIVTIDDGGLVSVGGTLAIDYNGGADSFINITTGGTLALFGDADDSLADFLDLIVGTDAIRYWDESIIDWADITGATPVTDYRLAYVDDTGSDLYCYTLLTVGPISQLTPGDANGDRFVDAADASILGSNWQVQSGATWAMGDFNLDEKVNDADAAILAAHWGEGGGEESVPEPGSLALLAGMAVMGMVCWRRWNV
jgi:T5SS/PEP-CTERM-associated repeat protein/autotransporter-associated beta strand protein